MSITGFFFEHSTITGPVMIYLDNGKVLTVINRVSHDNVDESTTSLFSLHAEQLKLLSQYNINKIRFSREDSGGGNYSANNIFTTSNPYKTETSINPTASDIKALFNY